MTGRPATEFQRARRPEQQDQRRSAILEEAEALLADVPVQDLSLRELSRRLGTPKSNVVRYFGTREGVLLELLQRGRDRWLLALESELGSGPGGSGPLVESWARTLAADPLLCQLWSQLATVLERNVSVDSIRRHKLAELEHRQRLARLVRCRVPGIGDAGALHMTRVATVALAGLWPFCSPTQAMTEATADPRLHESRMDFATAYADILGITLTGLLARERASET
ncbi:TetR family transcriptional regulator [Nocardiopsis exhalans]|uniref:TetR family transcriptional regulator n=1 Tax=Nocardiopsis exhalans TaxID=163604 RepID=A0ABY5DD80_9ACTN|nr:TetR family transcriptional regulator [Nocardiopsis exhalans]USY22289.1 TetR family transcriptional regulator [Nocardiopsis exhalans]